MSNFKEIADKIDASPITTMSMYGFLLLISGFCLDSYATSQMSNILAWISIPLGILGLVPLFVLIIFKMIQFMWKYKLFCVLAFIGLWIFSDLIKELSFFEKCLSVSIYMILSILYKIHSELLETKKRLNTLSDDR